MSVLKLVRYQAEPWMPGDDIFYQAEDFQWHRDMLGHLLGRNRDGDIQDRFGASRLHQVVFLAELHGWRVETRKGKGKGKKR